MKKIYPAIDFAPADDTERPIDPLLAEIGKNINDKLTAQYAELKAQNDKLNKKTGGKRQTIKKYKKNNKSKKNKL